MTKDFYNELYKEDHASRYDGGDDGMPERVREIWHQTDDWLTRAGIKGDAGARILEIGCGMAYLSKIHPGWHGAEYSKTAVERVKQRDGVGARISEENAQSLTYQDCSFEAVFSFAALEHVPNPNRALEEIDRVLLGGGCAMISPAWNCRSWTVKKIEQRPWSHLSFLEKLERFSIPLREHIIYRALMRIPSRLYSELAMVITGSPLHLRYKTLNPRWDLIDQYGHVSDDDAVADIDSHAGIVFFKSRGYRILSHPTLLARIMARHEAVIVQKSSSDGRGVL